MNLESKATAAGTGGYAEKHANLNYRMLGDTGLSVSEAGFGGYRITTAEQDHEAALEQALCGGINLIDTSANYTGGQSEQLIGRVLNRLSEAKLISREEVVVVSKNGCLQGESLRLNNERKSEGAGFPETFPLNEFMEFSLHPQFLADQISGSLERMQLTTIDCYLLHNPEYYLLWAQEQKIEKAAAHQEFYRRIETAFRFLEEEVAAGRIGCYGISSNTFSVAEDNYEYISLTKLWEIAQQVSTESHFKIIEFPLNVYETAAALKHCQGEKQTVLEFAAAKNWGVLINRPLNAVNDGQIYRLVELPGEPFRDIPLLVNQIKVMMELEDKFRRTFIMQLSAEELNHPELFQGLSSGEKLQKDWYMFDSYWHWEEAKNGYFLPLLQHCLDLLSNRSGENRELKNWLGDYRKALETIFTNITNYYRGREQQRIELNKTVLIAADKDWKIAAPLSQLALRALRSTAGISSVLVGMRRASYVEDVFTELTRPVAGKERQIGWEKLQSIAAKSDLDSIALIHAQMEKQKEEE